MLARIIQPLMKISDIEERTSCPAKISFEGCTTATVSIPQNMLQVGIDRLYELLADSSFILTGKNKQRFSEQPQDVYLPVFHCRDYARSYLQCLFFFDFS